MLISRDYVSITRALKICSESILLREILTLYGMSWETLIVRIFVLKFSLYEHYP